MKNSKTAIANKILNIRFTESKKYYLYRISIIHKRL